MSKTLISCQVTIVVDMMLTLVTIRRTNSFFRLRVVVEGNGNRHWQIHQHQKPRKPFTSIVEIMHYPKQSLYKITLDLKINTKVVKTDAKVTFLMFISKGNKHFLS